MSDYEHLKLCAARYAYVRANQHCPNPLPNGNRITWRRWWERMYGAGESLEHYAERMRTANAKTPKAIRG